MKIDEVIYHSLRINEDYWKREVFEIKKGTYEFVLLEYEEEEVIEKPQRNPMACLLEDYEPISFYFEDMKDGKYYSSGEKHLDVDEKYVFEIKFNRGYSVMPCSISNSFIRYTLKRIK